MSLSTKNLATLLFFTSTGPVTWAYLLHIVSSWYSFCNTKIWFLQDHSPIQTFTSFYPDRHNFLLYYVGDVHVKQIWKLYLLCLYLPRYNHSLLTPPVTAFFSLHHLQSFSLDIQSVGNSSPSYLHLLLSSFNSFHSQLWILNHPDFHV